MDRSTVILWLALALLVVSSAFAAASSDSSSRDKPDLGNPLLESSSRQDQRPPLKERDLLRSSQIVPEDGERSLIEGLVSVVESCPSVTDENSRLSGLYVDLPAHHYDSLALIDPNHAFSSDILAEIVFGMRTPSLKLDASPFRIGVKAHPSRSTRAVSPSISALASWTNDTFQAAVCSQVSTDTRYLYMYGLPGIYFVIPSCVATYPHTMTQIVGQYLILEDFKHFPVGLEHLELTHCIGAPSNLSSEANNGFDPDGSVNWTEVLSIVKNTQTLRLNDCRLRGPFPAAFPGGSPLYDFQMMNNQLTGPLVASFFNTWNRASMLRVLANGNQINGTLPATWFQRFKNSATLGTGYNIHLDFSDNRLSGSIPSQWLPASKRFAALILLLARNELTGSIPADFLPASLSSSTISIDISQNLLSGSIPPAIFHTCFSTTTWQELLLDASHNRLNGTLPSSLLTTWPTSPVGLFSLNIANNSLTGTIPPTMVSPNRNVSFTNFYLYLDHNRLNGSLPEQMLWSENNATGEITAITFTSTATLSLDSNEFEGSIPPKLLTYFTAPSTAKLQFWAVQNRFSGSIPDPSFGPAALEYLISLNSNISGTIPPSWFASLNLLRFEANGTGLTGDLPPVLPTLSILDLSNTKVDFCSDSSKDSTSNFSLAGTCSVYGTSACGCSANYTRCGSCCTGTAPPNFECVDGAWVSTVLSSAPVIVIPSTTNPVVIVGNLTVTELVITGIGSAVVIKGSVFNLTTLSIILEKDDLKDLSQDPVPLLTIEGGDNATSTAVLAAVQVQTRVRNSCKSVKPKSYAADNTLYGMFVVSKGTCDRWWIITVAVVGSVLVILLVVGLIVLLTRKPTKDKPNKAAVG